MAGYGRERGEHAGDAPDPGCGADGERIGGNLPGAVCLFACLRDLKKVWLVVSDASAGLQAAIRKDLIGASSNTPERLNREISLRSRVVGIFPGIGSYLWLVITYLIECEEDWQSGRSYIKAESLARRQVLLTEAA